MNLFSPPWFCRLASLALFTLALAGNVRAELPALLREAFANSNDDEGHWAYTETTTSLVKRSKETKATKTIVRFDPSKPYAEQYTPQLVEDHAPTAKDLKEYRKKGEDRGDELARQQKAEAQKPSGKAGGKELSDAETRKYLDVDHISVGAETATEITYLLPVRKGAKAGSFKLENVDLVVRVDKQEKIVSHLGARLNDSVRMFLLLKIKSGELAVSFARVDPEHGPVQTKMVLDADISVLLMKATAHAEMDRTDFRHVTPYEDRFTSSIGPLKVLGF